MLKSASKLYSHLKKHFDVKSIYFQSYKLLKFYPNVLLLWTLQKMIRKIWVPAPRKNLSAWIVFLRCFHLPFWQKAIDKTNLCNDPKQKSTTPFSGFKKLNPTYFEHEFFKMCAGCMANDNYDTSSIKVRTTIIRSESTLKIE